MPLFRRTREKRAERKRIEELKRHEREISQRRKVEAARTACDGHDHNLSSVPYIVQKDNPWVLYSLLRQYIRENEIDTKQNAGYGYMIQLLFDNAQLKELSKRYELDLESFFTYSDVVDSTLTKFQKDYILRNYEESTKELSKFALIDKSASGTWFLTPAGIHESKSLISHVDRRHGFLRADCDSEVKNPCNLWLDQASFNDILWTIHNFSPDAFERLCQQLLREIGVEGVRVTGKSGDNGIDGLGTIFVPDLTSIPIVFQCKRYKGSVGVSAVRDLRGAMDGRVYVGLLITTGTFTRQARAEAEREGSRKIELIDGEGLARRLKKYSFSLDSL